MEKDGVPTVDLIEGVEFKPEISGDRAELNALLAGEKPAPKPESGLDVVTEPVAEQEWIHEPTGKAFKTEGERAIYESGAKSNELGELRARLKAFEEIATAKGEQPQAPPPTLTKEQQEQNLVKLAFPNHSAERLEDGGYMDVAKGMENLIVRHNEILGREFTAIRERLDKFESTSTEQNALHASGLDMAKIQSTLEKHPYLKSLAPKERLAVIADLVTKPSGEKPPANTLRDRLQPNAADHVEGSASNMPVETQEAALMKKAGEMSDEDLLKFLGDETAKGGMPWEL